MTSHSSEPVISRSAERVCEAMKNPVYDRTVTALSNLIGGSPQDFVSGTGCRFTNSRRGKLSVYHSNIAVGNRAEVAFHVESLSERLGLGAQEVAPYFSSIAGVTKRPTNPDLRFNWPRVGLVSEDDVTLLIDHLSQRYVS